LYLRRSEYPEIAKNAVQLLPVVSTYCCETAFSKYTYTKNKRRGRLDPEADMRIQLSIIKPEFENKSGNQVHPSH
jgi:hypothetical protein